MATFQGCPVRQGSTVISLTVFPGIHEYSSECNKLVGVVSTMMHVTSLILTIFASMECGPMKGLPNGHIPAKGSLLMASSWLEG